MRDLVGPDPFGGLPDAWRELKIGTEKSAGATLRTHSLHGSHPSVAVWKSNAESYRATGRLLRVNLERLEYFCVGHCRT